MYLRSVITLLFLVVGSSLQAKPTIVVTTTLIASAVQDVAGDSFELEILMPAGTCPGQFDLDPQQAGRVAHANLIIRHDMQSFLDRLFIAAGAKPEAIIAPRGTFTIPSTYVAYCEKIADELRLRMPELAPAISKRLITLQQRSAALSVQLKAASAQLAGTRVVAAVFQVDLLNSLGLQVVATFPPADDPSPAMLQKVIAVGRDKAAVLVVGNLQNGTRIPETLANTLGVPCIILSNFPPFAGSGAQETLIKHNLEQLLAWKRQAIRNSRPERLSP